MRRERLLRRGRPRSRDRRLHRRAARPDAVRRRADHRRRPLRRRAPDAGHQRRRRRLPRRGRRGRQGRRLHGAAVPDRRLHGHRLRRPRAGPPVRRQPHLQRHPGRLRGRQPQRRDLRRARLGLLGDGLRRHLRHRRPPAAHRPGVLPAHHRRGHRARHRLPERLRRGADDLDDRLRPGRRADLPLPGCGADHDRHVLPGVQLPQHLQHRLPADRLPPHRGGVRRRAAAGECRRLHAAVQRLRGPRRRRRAGHRHRRRPWLHRDHRRAGAGRTGHQPGLPRGGDHQPRAHGHRPGGPHDPPAHALRADRLRDRRGQRRADLPVGAERHRRHHRLRADQRLDHDRPAVPCLRHRRGRLAGGIADLRLARPQPRHRRPEPLLPRPRAGPERQHQRRHRLLPGRHG